MDQLADEVIVEEAETEIEATAEVEAVEAEAPAEAPAEESDELTVTIGEEAPPPEESNAAPEWVRELRQEYRKLQRENRELKAKVAPVEVKPTLGQKPTLAQFDYDEDAHAKALDAWYEQKRQVEQEQEKAKAAEAEAAREWQTKLEGYSKAKAELKVKHFDEAESVAQDIFSITQQGIILEGAENPALVVYALGSNPKKARELSAITNPVKFAVALAKLETQLKVNARKTAPPPPEKGIAASSAPKSGSVDSVLDRLREEADRTGDRSKVAAYLRSKKS